MHRKPIRRPLPHEALKSLTAQYIGKRISTDIFNRVPTRQQFLEKKKAYMEFLKHAMPLPQQHGSAIALVLQPCVKKLNRLPFLYTWNSAGPQYMKDLESRNFLRSPPKGAKQFIYHPPFIAISLDGSKQSLLFWQKAAELTQKKEHSGACLIPPEPDRSFEIRPSSEMMVGPGWVKASELKQKLAEAERFFKALEKVADEFLKKG